MRLYTFVNFYLSSIQQGIQTAHIVSEIFAKYDQPNSVEQYQLKDWARNHKTIIVLNGGNSKSLSDLASYFVQSDVPYPWTDFYEDEDSLQSIMTAVGILLPESIYTEMETFRKTKELDPLLNPNAQELIMLVSGFGLAK